MITKEKLLKHYNKEFNVEHSPLNKLYELEDIVQHLREKCNWKWTDLELMLELLEQDWNLTIK